MTRVIKSSGKAVLVVAGFETVAYLQTVQFYSDKVRESPTKGASKYLAYVCRRPLPSADLGDDMDRDPGQEKPN
jgi:hypothetical protein